MEESRKKKIVSVVALMLLLFMMIGASVAYFVGQIDTGATADINAITGTTDSLMFKVGDPINLVANMTNFKEGDGNVNSTTYANATLIANNGTNEASYNYNLYLDIMRNDLVYTTSDKKPELLLKITSKDNSEDTNEEATEITSGITGVEYKTITTTSGTYSGFDITEKKGTVEIALNHEISTTSRKTNNWEIEVIFVNLDSDQQLNTEKVFRSELRIGTEEVEEKEPTLADACVGRNMAECFKENYQLDSNIYLHDSNLANSAEDGSYRYAGGGPKLKEGYEKYNAIKELTVCYLTDSDGNSTEIVDKGTEGAVCEVGGYYALNDGHATDIEKWWDLLIKSDILEQELTEEDQQFITSFEQIGKEQQALGNKMIFYNFENAYNQYVKNGGIVERYKIVEDIVKNYVCFGSTENTCHEDNLYRVIGVFGNNVKLIKADYASKELLGTDGDYSSNVNPQENPHSIYEGSQTTVAHYHWNYNNNPTINSENGSNNWSTSLLNKVNLNTNYLNNIGDVWTNKIAMSTWYLGGWNTCGITAKEMYGYERGTMVPSGNPETYEAKVGLMYPSDYGYATTPENWTTNLSAYHETNVMDNSWLHLGETEWTISPNSNSSSAVFDLDYIGPISGYGYAIYGFALRPVLYLEAFTILTGGNGTKSLPYRIS